MSDNENPNGVPRPLPDAASKSQQEWRESQEELAAMSVPDLVIEELIRKLEQGEDV
jgi:hypothetical protein